MTASWYDTFNVIAKYKHNKTKENHEQVINTVKTLAKIINTIPTIDSHNGGRVVRNFPIAEALSAFGKAFVEEDIFRNSEFGIENKLIPRDSSWGIFVEGAGTCTSDFISELTGIKYDVKNFNANKQKSHDANYIAVYSPQTDEISSFNFFKTNPFTKDIDICCETLNNYMQVHFGIDDTILNSRGLSMERFNTILIDYLDLDKNIV